MTPNLHDATFLRLATDWRSGEVALEFTRATEVITLKATNISALSLTRGFPWGQSISVNSVHVTEGNRIAVKIEMQSGDLITFEAASLSVLSAPG